MNELTFTKHAATTSVSFGFRLGYIEGANFVVTLLNTPLTAADLRQIADKIEEIGKEQLYTDSEASELRELISDCPPDRPVDRSALEARLREIEAYRKGAKHPPSDTFRCK